MRKRDTEHEANLNSLIQLDYEQIKRLLLFNDFHHSDYVAS